jgi:hypothetical protein
LRLWFEFSARDGLTWNEVGIEDVGWVRALAGRGRRRPATVNWYLAGVFGFYDHPRSGVGMAAKRVAWRRSAR